MTKKVFIAAVCITVVGAASLLYGVSKNQTKEDSIKYNGTQTTTNNVKRKPSDKLKAYTDGAGFSFKYPQDLSVDKKDSLDDTTYADLSLKSEDLKGSIAIKVVDSKAKTIDEWIKTDATASAATETKEAKIGSLVGKELHIKDRVIFAAIDQGILFTIDVLPYAQEDFWLPSMQTVTSSFTFTPPQQAQTSSSGGSGGDDVVFDGEEVVE